MKLCSSAISAASAAGPVAPRQRSRRPLPVCRPHTSGRRLRTLDTSASSASPRDPFASPSPRRPRRSDTSATDPFGSAGGRLSPKQSTSGRTTLQKPLPRAPAQQIGSLKQTDDIAEVAVLPVPTHMQRPGHGPIGTLTDPYVKYIGLEDLLPGSGLADLFDSDSGFRRALRVAARDDMFIANPNFSDAANAQIKDIRASLMVGWRSSPSNFLHLTDLFSQRGIALDGPTFMAALGGLVSGDNVAGSLIDIVGITGREVEHSWHQDNGLTTQVTAMLGFPPQDGYNGAGVFSHIAKLSNVLAQPGEEGEVIQYEETSTAGTGVIPEEHIVRPVYQKGAEIVVYNDAYHLHSAPDFAHRESLWRLM